MNAAAIDTSRQAVEHLQPATWEKVNRLLVRKAIAEFSHERLFEPRAIVKDGVWCEYVLAAEDSDIEYRFRAQLLFLEHWLIDAGSISKQKAGSPAAVDAMEFFIEFAPRLGIKPAMLPVYLEEIASTLYGSAYKHARGGLPVRQLAMADFQEIEAAMMEGHPCFVANNGRIGFDAVDYRRYAPEVGERLSLVWIAVHRELAVVACIDGLDYEAHLATELGEQTLAEYRNVLVALGLDPADYLFMPVHPWQWHNKITSIFSAAIATRRIVLLGKSRDSYQAQQSIRTFFNHSAPHRCYVKTALSVLNMGFMRGLSPYYMSTTPAINGWLHGVINADPYLQARGFGILREIAAVGFRNDYYERAIAGDSAYKKMLAALWRESPVPTLREGQRLMTMAALLHVDAEGEALLPELIRSSGLDADSWLRRYLDSYLAPLLHCFYAHDLVFMPHGENLILVMENNVPVRAIMKDTGEECAVLNPHADLPDMVRRIAVDVPDELKTLSIFTDIFDCFFRFMAAILHEHAGYAQQRFWRQVADCVRDYQAQHPELQKKFARYDLFAPEFIRSCLNRLQLANNQQMIDLADPAKNLQFVGTLQNPIAAVEQEMDVQQTAVAGGQQ